jgi:phenylacetate-CoA ligase
VSVRAYLYRSILLRGKLETSDRYYHEAAAFDPDRENPYLRTLLEHAREHVPYYRDLIGPDVLASFPSLPSLSKDTIRSEFERLKSERHVARTYLNSTGGSTGRPLNLLQDVDYKEWARATENYFYREFLGVDPLEVRTVMLWGSLQDITEQKKTLKKRLGMWLTQTVFLNSFKMSEPEMLAYVEAINRFKPVLMRCYAGSVYQFARFIKKRNLRIHRPRFIYSSAESMQPFMRELVEEVFGCKVYDVYGAREVGISACECSRGKMHVLSFSTIMEVVDEENRPVPPGNQGRILCTGLHNLTMPLIRYEIGDLAVAAEGCDCGSRLPALQSISGRIIDHFVHRDGTLVHGGYFIVHLFFKEWIDEFQIVQRDVDDIEIFYRPRLEPVEKDMTDIIGKYQALMGKGCKVTWTRVDEVPRTPQGKLLHARTLVEPV